MTPKNAHPGLSPALTVLIAIATGLAVASNYYAQPLLETIATSFNLSVNQAGFIVTAAQLGYATGLLLLVPLGDMFERRGLIVFMTLLAAGGMLITATSATLPMMILGTALTHRSEHNPDGYPLLIGEDVTVGHKAMLHGCAIGNRVLVGMGSILLDGVVVEDDVMIGAGSLVAPGKRLASGYLYMGSPARQVRPLTAAELEGLLYSSNNYVRWKDEYLSEDI